MDLGNISSREEQELNWDFACRRRKVKIIVLPKFTETLSFELHTWQRSIIKSIVLNQIKKPVHH
jgi:hypothetical protein